MNEKASHHSGASYNHLVPRTPQRRSSLAAALTVTLLLLGCAFYRVGVLLSIPCFNTNDFAGTDTLTQCAWSELHQYRSIVEQAVPLGATEYVDRRAKLSGLLQDNQLDLFIAEPSVSTLYYGNFSNDPQSNGASWALSERPFLLVVTAGSTSTDNHTFLLAPEFETSRAKALPIPTTSKHDVTVVPWKEGESPYLALKEYLREQTGRSTFLAAVDPDVRFFIADGLQHSDIVPRAVPERILAIREQKTDSEIDILSRVNQITLRLIQSLRPCLSPGVSEADVTETVQRLFVRSGLARSAMPIVLFGDNAAMPHGSGKDRRLGEDEFVLMDLTTTLYGYFSDITRTVLPPGQQMSNAMNETWNLVYAAQSAAIEKLRAGQICSDVDSAARQVISDRGLGKYFTHRLGHGIGLEDHERPFLDQGNREKVILAGNTFTDEPGVYIEGQIGVRIEDVVLVSEHGPRLLAGSRALDPWNP